METQPIINGHNKQEYPPMHTAEHLLNGLMARKYGCGRAFSAHVERKKSKLDFHLDRQLSVEELADIEREINSIISQNIPVTIDYITQSEASEHFDMNRLPDNASDTVRVVSIGDHDKCLCAGSHVASTSEIGEFHISSTRYCDGVFRIVFRLG
ncbi:MAG: hypothetical protein K2M98_00885 [Muribaculum sp.]|nr:hypothetical protein [Muribaculum sp.]